MAASARLRLNGVLCGTVLPTLGAALTDDVGTTITFADVLNFGGTQAVPTFADPIYLPLVIDPDSATEEIVWLTAYTEGATTGTILRAQENSIGIAHSNGAPIVHGPTAADAVDWSAVDVTGVVGDDAISFITEAGGIYIAANDVGDKITISAYGANIVIHGNGDLTISGAQIGFFGGAAAPQPTGVAVTAAAIHAALVSLGLITA